MLPVHGAVQERGEGVGEVDGEEMCGRRTAGGLQASSAPPRHRPGLLSPVQHRDDGLTGAEPGRHDLTVELQRLLHELGGDGLPPGRDVPRLPRVGLQVEEFQSLELSLDTTLAVLRLSNK